MRRFLLHTEANIMILTVIFSKLIVNDDKKFYNLNGAQVRALKSREVLSFAGSTEDNSHCTTTSSKAGACPSRFLRQVFGFEMKYM